MGAGGRVPARTLCFARRLFGSMQRTVRRTQETDMTKKIAPQDNSSNMKNANKGTPGTNKQYDQNQGNRGKQMLQEKAATPPGKSKGNR